MDNESGSLQGDAAIADTDLNANANTDEDVTASISLDDRFQFIGMDYLESIEALRETHLELTPAASGLDNSPRALTDSFALLNLDDNEKRMLRPAFENAPESGLSPLELLDRMLRAVGETAWGPEFILNFMKRAYRPKREPIFHDAMLISLVSSFEAHLAKLAGLYYQCAPVALSDVPKEAAKEFSLRELQDMDSIQDAVDTAIERRVTKLMFGSLGDWKKFFAERMNIDLADMSVPWKEIVEIFERRHCLVHNDARASRRYAEAVEDSTYDEELHASQGYVSAAIEKLELVGLVLHVRVWKKFTEDVTRVSASLEDTSFAALQESRWAFAQALYELWQRLPLSAKDRRTGEVNLWLVKRELNGLDAVRAEIEAWDVSDADELFTFAKHCLLEQVDEAFAMVPSLLERDKLGGRALARWPIAAVLRRDPRIDLYRDQVRAFLREEATDATAAESGAVGG